MYQAALFCVDWEPLFFFLGNRKDIFVLRGVR